MNAYASRSIAELESVESRISAFLDRVDRRSRADSAAGGDQNVNASLSNGLLPILEGTKIYLRARQTFLSGDGLYSMSQHVQYLDRFAAVMPAMTKMLRAVDPLSSGDGKGLSPLFRRMAHREFQEVQSMAASLRKVIERDALLFAAPELGDGKNPYPLPVAPTALIMPYIIVASSFMAGCMAAQKACFDGWAKMMTAAAQAPAPRPSHLRLVIDNT